MPTRAWIFLAYGANLPTMPLPQRVQKARHLHLPMRTRIFAPAAPTTHHHHLRHTKKINRAWWFQFRIRGCAGAAKVGSAAATRPIGASWAHHRKAQKRSTGPADRPRKPGKFGPPTLAQSGLLCTKCSAARPCLCNVHTHARARARHCVSHGTQHGHCSACLCGAASCARRTAVSGHVRVTQASKCEWLWWLVAQHISGTRADR